ncbi:MAG: exodeoxyribonuclease III [Burkholderiaceae bacterium]
MKITTWNVNSLRVRLPQVLTWLQTNPVDILGIQETKLVDAKFPTAEIAQAGYDVVFAGQPTYNGVALLTRRDTIASVTDVVTNNPDFPDEQARLITATCDGLRICCAYVPNGQDVESDKYGYKLAWLDALAGWLGKGAGAPGKPLVLLGDFNIAPADADVHDPVAWEGKVLCSAPERARFAQLLALGLVDSFRQFDQPEKIYSWWDYRQLGFRRNAGLRIDHVLVARPLLAALRGCSVDKAPRKWEKPSDHAPVTACFERAALPG